MIDPLELKPGLILFRRADVQHDNWYCRIKIPGQDRYKTTSLKTPDLSTAREHAFDLDADLRFRVKHNVPIFEKTFEQVAREFLDHQRARSQAGQISHRRWQCMESHVKAQLGPYVGHVQISTISEEIWSGYPLWRKQTGKSCYPGPDDDPLPPSDSTIRSEMVTFRAIMGFAASKKYVPEDHVFTGRVTLSRERRDAFAPAEYRKLHQFARRWVKDAPSAKSTWCRSTAYNFILIMTNTGMRPSEAKNLRWRDVAEHTDAEGRTFVSLAVRGKGKSRELVAAHNVQTYLERVRELSHATTADNHVFTTIEGKPARTLYTGMIRDLLEKSGLLVGPSGKPRCTYCFRHTYATFRLTEGIDVYFLAKQMGTSVKMIEDHYGHITPIKNAERILQGVPGWEPITDSPEAGS